MNRDANNKSDIGCVEERSASRATTSRDLHAIKNPPQPPFFKGGSNGWMLLAALLVVMTLPAMIWYQQTGELGVYYSPSTPPGQLLYVLSKLAGMYALLFIALQIIVSLAGRLKQASIPHLRLLHPLLGTFVVLLGMTHALLFFAAVSVRQGDPAWGLLFPGFRDFYHTHLTLGLFGLWILITVMISGFTRSINRSHFAKILHRGYWLAIVLVYIHALAIGTETQSRLGLALYSILGGVAMMLLVAWLIRRNRSVAVAS